MDKILLARTVNFLKDQAASGLASINANSVKRDQEILLAAAKVARMTVTRRAGSLWILTHARQKPYHMHKKED